MVHCQHALPNDTASTAPKAHLSTSVAAIMHQYSKPHTVLPMSCI